MVAVTNTGRTGEIPDHEIAHEMMKEWHLARRSLLGYSTYYLRGSLDTIRWKEHQEAESRASCQGEIIWWTAS